MNNRDDAYLLYEYMDKVTYTVRAKVYSPLICILCRKKFLSSACRFRLCQALYQEDLCSMRRGYYSARQDVCCRIFSAGNQRHCHSEKHRRRKRNSRIGFGIFVETVSVTYLFVVGLIWKQLYYLSIAQL